MTDIINKDPRKTMAVIERMRMDYRANCRAYLGPLSTSLNRYRGRAQSQLLMKDGGTHGQQ